jgi:hypothetical protein
MSSPQDFVTSAHAPLPPQPEVEDECLKPEVLLHITFEVIFQLDKATEARWLSPEEISLRDFLVEQYRSLHMVIRCEIAGMWSI